MAGSQNHRLAAAVYKAGGLGSIPAAMLTTEQLQNELAAFADAIGTDIDIGGNTRKTDSWGQLLPVNVNFFCHKPPAAQAETEAAWR